MCVGVQFNFYIVLLLSLRLRLPYRVEDRAGECLRERRSFDNLKSTMCIIETHKFDLTLDSVPQHRIRF